MSAPQHTPGPWKYGHFGTNALWVGPDYDRTPVALVDHDTPDARENSRANAEFIVRACNAHDELVAALTAILNEETVSVHVGYDSGSGGGNYVYADAVRTDSDAFVAARRLLAKATGAA